MKKVKLPKLYRRKWLNRDKGSAYVIVSGEVYAGSGKNVLNRHVSAEISLKDCNRQCELEFYYGEPKRYKQRLQKIDDLLSSLQELKDFMVANPPVSGKKATVAELKEHLATYDFSDDEDDFERQMIEEAIKALEKPKVKRVRGVVEGSALLKRT